MNSVSQDSDIQDLVFYTNENCPFLLTETIVNSSVYCLEYFAVEYNSNRNSTILTIHKITPDQLLLEGSRIKAKRLSNFRPIYINGVLSRNNYDYQGTGYDRGHLVPAGDFVWNQNAKDQTFYHVNITHQKDFLNRGRWAGLENQIRNKVLEINEEALVITGIYFSDNDIDQIGPNQVDIGEAFYKILYFPRTHEVFSWLMLNEINSEEDIKASQISINQLEALTRRNFLEKLPDEIEDNIEMKVNEF